MPTPDQHEVSDACTLDLAPLIERERAAMQNDLLRARELLRDGMSKLHGLYNALQESQGADSELTRTAVLGLQLEDVLGQLIEYTSKRANCMSSLAGLLAQAVDPDTLARDSALSEQLRRLVAETDQRAIDLSVRQESLGSGDVELF